MDVSELRALADWLDEHPEANPPLIGAVYHAAVDRKGLVSLARSIGGQWAKGGDDDWFELTQEIMPGVEYRLFVSRAAVCERRVIATHTEEIEAPDPELLAKVPLVKTEKVVEKVEWVCPPSLLTDAA